MNYWLDYEKSFADLVGASAARATSLGRQALVLLLKAVGVQQGDRVGVCAFTCLSVIEAVKVAGGVPVYLDVDECLCIDPESIRRQEKNSLKVVILQHTFGNPGKLDQLLESCKEINAIVIEDCAHALGCCWNGKPLGRFGVGAIYSFQWGKPYTTGEGGMLTVNSEPLLRKIDAWINEYSVQPSLGRDVLYEIQRMFFGLLNGTWLERELRRLYKQMLKKDKNYKISKEGDNWILRKGYIQRPGRLTVRAGMKQIKKWPNNMERRRQNTAVIENELQKHHLQCWPRQQEADVTYLRYPIWVSSKERLLSKASKLSLDLAGWYFSPVHPLCNKDLNQMGYFMGMASNAERAIKSVVHMPTGKGMTPKTLSAIIQLLISDKEQ